MARPPRAVWSAHSGGKARVAKFLAALIPPHRLYIEPFAGAGSVFFALPKPIRTVINDKDWEIAEGYILIQSLNDNEIAELEGTFPWQPNKNLYDFAQSKPYRDRVGLLWSFLYVRRNSFYGQQKIFSDKQSPPNHPYFLRLKGIRNHLKGARIECQDALGLLPAYHRAQNSFAYLDPPYPNTTQKAKGWVGHYSESDFDALLLCLENRKDPFLLSVSPTVDPYRFLDHGFHIAFFPIRRSAGLWRGGGNAITKAEEWVVSNYILPEAPSLTDITYTL